MLNEEWRAGPTLGFQHSAFDIQHSALDILHSAWSRWLPCTFDTAQSETSANHDSQPMSALLTRPSGVLIRQDAGGERGEIVQSPCFFWENSTCRADDR